MNWRFEDAAFSINHALLFSIGDFGSNSDRRVEAKQARSGSAHAFAQNSLRHELEGHFLGGVALLKVIRMRAWERGDDVRDLVVLEHQSQLAIASPAIVGDRGDIFGPLTRQRLNQIIGEAGAAESAEHDTS